MFTDLVLYGSGAGNHSCCGFVSEVVNRRQHFIALIHILWLVHYLPSLPSGMFLETCVPTRVHTCVRVWVLDTLFRTEPSTVTIGWFWEAIIEPWQWESTPEDCDLSFRALDRSLLLSFAFFHKAQQLSLIVCFKVFKISKTLFIELSSCCFIASHVVCLSSPTSLPPWSPLA